MMLALFIAAALAGPARDEALADAAIQARKAADQSGAIEDYASAAEAFQDALRRIPDRSDEGYQLRWYLAETLYRAKAWREAADEYEWLLDREAEHPYGDGSAYQLMRCWQELAGPTDRLPEDAVVERVYTTEWGKEITVYALSPEATELVEALDRVLTRSFRPAEAGQPDWKATVEQNRRALVYIGGALFQAHAQYSEARDRLQRLLDPPCGDEARYAAQHIVDAYVAEGNPAASRAASVCTLGAFGDDHWRGCSGFPSSPEQAEFKRAMELVGTDRHAAAEAFLAWREQFPESEYAGLALYNAATSNDVIGEAQRANELYEQYVAEYPKDEKSAQLYFRVASNHESYFDLPGAIDAYDRLVEHFPKDPSAADAFYNAAFLHVALHQPAEAARRYEEYAARWPDRPDAEEVAFQAGEQWALVSRTDEVAFYERYLQRWGETSPERAALARARLAGTSAEPLAAPLLELTSPGTAPPDAPVEIRPVSPGR
jgi:TolA-binding protein